MKKLVLASASIRRRDILKNTGYDFRVMVSGADEDKVLADLSPEEFVSALARLKGESVLHLVEDETVVLAADTIVYKDGTVYGKPADTKEAVAILSALSGKIHTVYTGIFIAQKGGESVSDYSAAKVLMAELEKTEIESYVKRCRPFDKAGSYGIQGPGALLVSEIEGDFFTIEGLPIRKVYERLKQFGILPVFREVEYL